jgi:hypothetical protein
MIKQVSEQLITVEEAMRLSYGDSGRDARQRERESIWAWQTVEGVLSQQVSDEAVSRMMARPAKKR